VLLFSFYGYAEQRGGTVLQRCWCLCKATLDQSASQRGWLERDQGRRCGERRWRTGAGAWKELSALWFH